MHILQKLSGGEVWACAWAGALALGVKPQAGDDKRVCALLLEDPRVDDGPWEKAVRKRAAEIVEVE